MMKNKTLDEQAEILKEQLRLLKPFATKSYVLDNSFGVKMRSTYIVKPVADLITDHDGEYYADYQLAWFHRNNYGIDPWLLIEKFRHLKFEQSENGYPYDWTIGENDIFNKVDKNIKDQTMQQGNLMFKPSIEHIVPQSLGGPRSDIRNVMILPLTINKALSNMTPDERRYALRYLSGKSYLKEIELAESLFYQ